MNRFRLPLLVVGAVVALLLAAVAVVFSATFQTWLARRTLASRADWRGSVENVSAGWSHLEIRGLELERAGVRLRVPAVEVDVPVLPAAWSRRLAIRRIVARGWTLDLSTAAPSANPPHGTGGPPILEAVPVNRGEKAGPAPGADGGTLAAARQMFAGVFRQLDLPFDLSLDGVVLDGDVVLPGQRGRLRVTVTGGGLLAGQEGRFTVTAAATLADPTVSHVDVKGGVVAAMTGARAFGRFVFQLDAAARGTRFPDGIGLHADLSASRSAAGESYTADVVAGGRSLLGVRAELPSGGPGLAGTWKLDVRDADLAPFSLGVPLPDFAAAGEGAFDADAAFSSIHVQGRLDATVDRWHVLRAELAAVGRLNVAADFDLTEQAGTLGVRKFDVAVRGSAPVAEVRTLQAFDFTPATRALRTADTDRELFGIVLQGVPVDWLRPWVSAAQLSGGRLQGGFTARAHQGGVSLRSTTPLRADEIGVFQAGKELVRRVDLTLRASADFTPQGWQAELAEATVNAGATRLVAADLKLGRLMGPGQAVKVAGRLRASLPALLAQPGLAGALRLQRGDAEVELAASLDGKREWQATVALRELAAAAGEQTVALPGLTTQLRADLAENGTITFRAPLTLEREGRRSDLTLVGTIGPETNRVRAVEAEVTGTEVHWDDARVLGLMVPEPPAGSAPAAPPWAGLNGSVALRLQRVIYSDTFELKEVSGRLKLDAGILRLEGGQAGVGTGGRALVNGLVTFDAAAQPAYGMIADVSVKEFDPAPFFEPRRGAAKALVEGRFDLSCRLAGHAPTLGGLIGQADGEFQLTSKGGVFRGLPVSVGTITETTSRWAAWLASAGSALSAVTGRRDSAEVANKTEAVAEVARALHPIVYDQLSVVLVRDGARNTTLRDFALISPELRLSGQGTVPAHPGGRLSDHAFAMEFVLRARGRQAELLRYLGVLEARTDDLGYAACTVPLMVGGTIGEPDTAELSSRLSALAIERSGLGEKAAEFLAWIRGGK